MADEEHDLVTEQSEANPYHQKCFPPFCENASPVDKQGISKMNRDDLEDRYIVYADENLFLKKRIRDHERHIQRLQTAIARQDNLDKKGGAKIPASMHYDNARVDSLESQNKHLEAKVKVLKQQLMNHSYIHTKDNRIAENKEKYRRGGVSPDSFIDNARTQSARRYKETSSPNRDMSALALKDRVAMLENQLKAQKEKYRERIIKLEQELAMLGKSDSSLTEQVSRHSRKVNDNVEMIRLRRLSQEQATQLAKLSDLNGTKERELAELKEALRQATEHADELEKQLQRERERALDAQANITKVTSHSETIRALEEQVRDLTNERTTLKDTNEQLLQLTTGAHSKSDMSLREQAHRRQLIKWLSQEQATQLAKLSDLNGTKERESVELRESLRQATEHADELEKQLQRERERALDAQANITKVTSHSETIRALEEQVRDLTNERTTLKDTNEQLLQLTTGAHSKSDRSLQEQALRRQVSQLELQVQEKIRELEKKDEQLIQMEALQQGVDRPHTPQTSVSQLELQLQEKIRELEEKEKQLHEMEALLQTATRPHTPPNSVSQLELQLQEKIQELQEKEEQLNKMEALLQTATRPHTPPTSVSQLELQLQEKIQELQEKEEQLNKMEALLQTATRPHTPPTSIHSKSKGSLSHTSSKVKFVGSSEKPISVVLHKSHSNVISPPTSEHLEIVIGQAERSVHSLSDHLHPVKGNKINAQERWKTAAKLALLSRRVDEEKQELEAKLENALREIEDLKRQLHDALIELEELRFKCLSVRSPISTPKSVSQSSSKRIVKDMEVIAPAQSSHSLGEKEELENRLAVALVEIQELKRIASEHAKCPRLRPKSPATPASSEHTITSVSSAAEVQQGSIMKWPLPKTVELYEDRGSPLTEPPEVSSMVPTKENPMLNQLNNNNELSSNVSSGDIATELLPLTPSLVKVKRLLERRRANIGTDPSTSSVALTISPSLSVEEEHDNPLNKKGAVTEISDAEDISYYSNVTGPGRKRFHKEEFKISVELQNLNYLEPNIEPSVSWEASKSADLPFFKLQKSALIPYTPKDDILRLFLVQVPRKASTIHWVEEVLPEPEQKPLWIIVSKHEFDTVLLQKKKYFSQTEVAMPADGSDMLNCRMDICIYDLEMDDRLVQHLSDLERDPHVFVEWSFLGMVQRTVSMPAAEAHFHTNVTYFGPLSGNMADFIRQRDMPIYLMLEKEDGPAVKVGEGNLDLTPAISQPQRGFLRCVNIAGSHGSSIVYCSFKLHDCCIKEDIPVSQTLEVSLGHLRLRHCNINNNPQATHLYFEYSLLGLCGPELETDSIPKSEVMNFNHTKCLRVHEDNANKLEPLLDRNNPKNLRFILLAEPCNLLSDTEVEEVGYAEINLVKEMVDKEKDIISEAVPVYSNTGKLIGSLSVTVLGISTIQNYTGSSSRKR